MKRGDARRQRGDAGSSPIRLDGKQGSRPIAYIERAVPAKRESTGNAQIGCKGFIRPVGLHAVNRPLEAARHVETASRVEHHRGRVDDAGNERLPTSGRTHAEDRDWNFLTAAAAMRVVVVGLTVEDRIVDLVQTGGKRRADLEKRGFPGRAFRADRGSTAVESSRH